MNKITYLELLELIKYNVQPLVIKAETSYGPGEFKWDEEKKGYYAVDSEKIFNEYGMDSDFVENLDGELVFEEIIEIVEKNNIEYSAIKPIEYTIEGENLISYYDLLVLLKNGICPRRLLVRCNGYYAHYEFDYKNEYLVVYDEFYSGYEMGLSWDPCLLQELEHNSFDKCIKIEE